MYQYRKSKIPGLGGKGEDIACSYLEKKGYTILDRNRSAPYGEIDIVAKDRQGMLVFIEVKTMTCKEEPSQGLVPEDNVSGWKLHKLYRTCEAFANARPEIVSDLGWRIDLIAITILPGPRCTIRQYENI